MVDIVGDELGGALGFGVRVPEQRHARRRCLAQQAQIQRESLHLPAPAGCLWARGEQRLYHSGRSLTPSGEMEWGVAIDVAHGRRLWPSREKQRDGLLRLGIARRLVKQRVPSAVDVLDAVWVSLEQGLDY